MDIRDLKYFCLTAELEHVSKAAEILGVAQPYLTKIIGQLEDEFGTELFDKVGRKIKLNENGEVFYRNAKKILSEVDNLYTEMDFLQEQNMRTISLFCNTEAHAHGMIVEFQKKNAKYALKLAYATRKEMLEALMTGAADFVLCDPAIDTDVSRNITTEIVFQDTACVMFPPGHPMLKRKSIKFEELQGERLVTASKGGAMRNHVDYVFDKYSVRPKIVCETHDVNLIIQAVLSGLGYAFISYSVLAKYPELGLYCIDIDSPDKYGNMGLSYNSLSIENRYMKDFLIFSREYFSNLQEKIAVNPAEYF
ncbi:MAG: LysR family transcriptional regulator [Oscillospiraceae bacterium]|nr:LysR family transcriptional regulator [Oscillospiraceae bacterium]